MTHYLRYKDKTIVDIETAADDLSSVVCIDVYTEFLFKAGRSSVEVADDFHAIQELRGKWFETLTPAQQREITIDQFVRQHLRLIAEKYGLRYVTD